MFPPCTNDKFVVVISRNNTILLIDDDGYTVGSISAPNRIELWLHAPVAGDAPRVLRRGDKAAITGVVL